MPTATDRRPSGARPVHPQDGPEKGLPVIADRLDDASSACFESSCQLGSRKIRHLDFVSASRIRADWSTMASERFEDATFRTLGSILE